MHNLSASGAWQKSQPRPTPAASTCGIPSAPQSSRAVTGSTAHESQVHVHYAAHQLQQCQAARRGLKPSTANLFVCCWTARKQPLGAIHRHESLCSTLHISARKRGLLWLCKVVSYAVEVLCKYAPREHSGWWTSCAVRYMMIYRKCCLFL